MPSLFARRTSQHLTRADLAERAGVSESMIWNMERGMPASEETTRMVEEALGEAGQEATGERVR